MARDKRLNIRISENLKREMDRSDKVWSDFVRNAIREELLREDAAIAENNISRLVRDCSDDIEKLWILHMFAEGISERRVYETAETLFREARDDTVQSMIDAASNHEVSLDAGEELKAAIARQGREKILEQVRLNIQDADRELKQGIYLLTHYVTGKFDSDSAHVIRDGFERTWKIYSDLDDDDADFDRIVGVGLAYKNYYSSNAYSHSYPRIPEYALEVLKEVRSDPESDGFQIYGTETKIGDILDKNHIRGFLRWMSGHRKWVNAYSENDEVIKDLTDEEQELQITFEDFERAREELIQSNALYIDYSPNRSSTGGRSSRPARWRYEITESGMQEIAEHLLKENL
jgi:hypothetical protein